MKVMLVLPRWQVEARDFKRCLDGLAVNFPGQEVTVAAWPEAAAAHQQALGLAAVVPYQRNQALDAFDVIAYIEVRGETEAQEASRLAPRKVYQFDFTYPYFRARPLLVAASEVKDYFAHTEAHVFNRLAPYGSDFMYYFPYGYIFKCLGMGPLNEFGLRIKEDLASFEKRPENHKVLAVFGGSATWSLDCLYPEMFSHRLEIYLNQWAQESGSPLKFSVLNMGQHGNVVMNEMLTYLLLCNRIKPEVVIAHDGFNDFLYGAYCDPWLLKTHSLCYQDNLEQWSRILHNTQDRPITHEGEQEYRVLNTPQAIVRAYVERKDQFRQIVLNRGDHFIWALQPFVHSKSGLAPVEQQYQERLAQLTEAYGEAFRNMKMLYQSFTQAVRFPPEADYIDFHRIFSQYGADRHLFADNVHPSPEGDDIIARVYFNYIRDKITSGQWFS